jgi:hypothetical protein
MYSESAIRDFEIKHDIELPAELRHHLVNVSSCNKFKDEIKLEIQEKYIDDNEEEWDYYDVGEEDEEEYNNLKCKEKEEEFVIKRGFNKCLVMQMHAEDSDQEMYIIVSGKFYGKVLIAYDGGSFVSCTDAQDFLVEPTYENIEPNYNIFRILSGRGGVLYTG